MLKVFKSQAVSKIFLLVLACLGFVSNAKAGKVGTLYNHCSEFKNSSFKVESCNAAICALTMEAVKTAKINGCVGFVAIYQNTTDKQTKELMVYMGKEQAIRHDADTVPLILGFLNWAEQNPDQWEKNAILANSNTWTPDTLRCDPSLYPLQ